MQVKSLLMHAVGQGKAIYASLGATWVKGTDGVGVACHNMGTARMSANPRDGVTNRWGQAHDVTNLFVSDGSVFTSSGAPNPTLTIVALAIRQAEQIAGRMGRGEPERVTATALISPFQATYTRTGIGHDAWACAARHGKKG